MLARSLSFEEVVSVMMTTTQELHHNEDIEKVNKSRHVAVRREADDFEVYDHDRRLACENRYQHHFW